ncbi:MAG TPA: DegT/DnrJ/EryC1/StrS family aminotransferase [Ginsengibacter sp.]|nr:DegT/DnrJ/EryC1/StrS family aminotransferase [Ginsengibacter sp.]
MIPVTKPFLPPIEDYKEYLDGIWGRNWLTNQGPLTVELERRLKDYLHLNHLYYVGSGMVALQIAIKALDLKGEIITTPFSYVATTSCIAWEGCKPVFVDIDSETLNIDPTKIEAAITPKTTAILATHCFGNACDIEAIELVAVKYNLKVIYDAAHCFGSKYKGKSIFEFGDISIVSFHATKLYHTIEGGALFTNDALTARRIRYMRNFGHSGPIEFETMGINGKNSEFHAAMGLVNLKYIDEIIGNRQDLSAVYDVELGDCVGRPTISSDCQFNYAYYPVLFVSEAELLVVLKELNENDIFPRRYFYPPLTQLPYVETTEVPICKDISRRILCLPLYHTLAKSEVQTIAGMIRKKITIKKTVNPE